MLFSIDLADMSDLPTRGTNEIGLHTGSQTATGVYVIIYGVTDEVRICQFYVSTVVRKMFEVESCIRGFRVVLTTLKYERIDIPKHLLRIRS